jgi:hypothetical protein
VTSPGSASKRFASPPRPAPIEEQPISLALRIELQRLIEQSNQLAHERVSRIQDVQPGASCGAARQDTAELKPIELLLDLNKIGVEETGNLAGVALVPGAQEDENSLSALGP